MTPPVLSVPRCPHLPHAPALALFLPTRAGGHSWPSRSPPPPPRTFWHSPWGGRGSCLASEGRGGRGGSRLARGRCRHAM